MGIFRSILGTAFLSHGLGKASRARAHVAALGIGLGMLAAGNLQAADKSTDAPGMQCWTVRAEVPDGPGDSRFLLAQSGETLSGTWQTMLGSAPISGRVRDGSIEMKTSLSYMGYDLVAQYRGKLADDKITGNADFDALGQGTFTAQRGCTGTFTQATWSAQPKAWKFDDRDGFVSIFDGTLNGWDGNPKFWRVEDGTIIGESSPTNPSGNAYLTYRPLTAHDFDLRLDIKLERGGSGIQYRSHTGDSWAMPAPPEVIANVGPYQPRWMLTGPQADLWAAQNSMHFGWSGQIYSENTPIGIQAFTGQVVHQLGGQTETKRLLGEIAPRSNLTGVINIGGWNKYEVVARGGVFMHFINGQLMSVLVDDDPNSANQKSGLFGLEIEGSTKVYVRNIYVKKLN